MPITYDITKVSFYKEGLEKTNQTIENMLRAGFEINIIANLVEMSHEYILQIQKEMHEKE